MLERAMSALHLIYPPRCLSCGADVAEDFGLCAECLRDTPFVLDPACARCGVPLVGQADAETCCDACLVDPPCWDRGRAAMRYDGRARAMVLALKHGDRTDLARPLGLWLARAARPLRRVDTVIVPVPLHPWRLFRRRYNQAALVAQALARDWQVDFLPDALVRTRRTPPQDHRSRAERYANLAASIQPHPQRGQALAGRPVVLVDDVLASGATLEVATQACRAAGASRVDIAVVTRVARADRV